MTMITNNKNSKRMKRFATALLALLAIAGTAKAQMPRWVMHPAYDNIHVGFGVPVIISDSILYTSLWNMDGKRMATTTDRLHPFREGVAVLTKRGADDLLGFYRPDGHRVSVDNFYMAYNHPFFSDGYLLAMQDSRPMFIDKDGKTVDFGYFEKAYPFSRGVASAMTYKSVEKQKNPYYFYLTTDKNPFTFTLNKKPVDAEDVDFLSSMGDFGMSVAIIKGKVYYYEQRAKMLKPIMSDDDKKKQLHLSGDLDECLTDNGDSIVINTHEGKKDNVQLVFDKLCKPLRIHFTKSGKTFERREAEPPAPTSYLSAFKGNDGQWGINYQGSPVLPAQFDSVDVCIGPFAIVRQKGKFGMFAYDKSLNYSMKVNKGRNVPFRHQKFETNIRLSLPTAISSRTARFEVAPSTGCEVDKTSIETRDTENGNYVQYNCTLTIPDSLPDVLTTVKYPVNISYDGLRLQPYDLTFRAWHYKYISVDVNEEETKVTKDNVSFTINVTADRLQGDNDYPLQVEVETGTLRSKLEKHSEARYTCYLYALNEGVNPVTVKVHEEGCPPSTFTFEINFKRPSSGNGKVAIEKKDIVAPEDLEAPAEEAPAQE